MQQIYIEHPYGSAVNLLCNIFEITLLHGCSPVNFLHIFRTEFFGEQKTYGTASESVLVICF